MGISYVAEVPSNIAFLKYWGKSDVEKQWPANDSFSMTLSHLCTRTTVKVWHGGYDHIISFGGKVLSPDTLFSRRIRKHVDFLSKKFPGSSGEKLRIDTHNSFPEECGIASSASGFGALTLGVCAAWSRSETLEELEQKGFDASLLSAFARTGSGSACRSMFEGFVLWEKGPSVDKQRVTSLFSKDHWDLSDTVVLVYTASKSVSSSCIAAYCSNFSIMHTLCKYVT